MISKRFIITLFASTEIKHWYGQTGWYFVSAMTIYYYKNNMKLDIWMEKVHFYDIWNFSIYV